VDKYVRVYRHSAADLDGEAYCTLLDMMNSAVAINDVESAQAQTLAQDFWVLFVKNEGATSITDLRLWKAADNETAAFGFSGPLTLNADGSYVDIGGESPAGWSWNTGTDFAGGLQMGTFTAGQVKAFALFRTPPTTPVPPEPAAHNRSAMAYRYTFSAVDYDGQLRGIYRIFRDAWEGWGLWHADDADPNFTTEPDEFTTSLPFTSTLTVAASSTGHVAIRKRNRAGLWEENTEITLLPRNADGTAGDIRPGNPQSLTLTAKSGGTVRVGGMYYPAPDGDTRADLWVVWLAKGTDPDPDVDTPAGYQRMGNRSGIEILAYDSGAYLDGADVRAIPRVRRLAPGTGTQAGTQTTQLPASGAGTIVTTDSFADWGASGYAATGDHWGNFREIVAFTKTDSTTLAVASGGRAQWGTAAGLGNAQEYVWPVVAVDSVNTTILTDVAEMTGPPKPEGVAFFGRAVGLWQEGPAAPLSTVWVDQGNNIYMTVADGSVSFYADTVLVWRAIYSAEIKRLYIPSEFDVAGTSVSGVGTSDAIETGTWNGTREIFVNVDESHEVRFNITGAVLEVFDLEDGTAAGLTAAAPWLQRDQATVFFCWNDETQDWEAYAQVTDDTMTIYADRLDNTLTEAEVEAL
jgi:hypothetical protein